MDKSILLKIMKAQLEPVLATNKEVNLRILPMDQVLTLRAIDEHVINEMYDELPDLAPYVNGVEIERNGTSETYRPTFNDQAAEDEWFRRLECFMNSMAQMSR